MWTRNLLLGVRGVLASVTMVVAVSASISALGMYRREGSLDSTVFVAIGAWFLTGWMWPDEKHRSELLERYGTEQRKPPFWLLPALGATIAGLLVLLTIAASVYWSHEPTITQLELDLAVKQGEYLVERQVSSELAGLLCQNSDTPAACHPRLLEDARRIVIARVTDG